MIRLWLAIAGLGGVLSVAVGALATHLVGDAKAAELLRIGALYGMVHSAALIAVIGFAQGREPRRGAAVVAGWSFAGGIVLFSGSLFVLALTGVERFGWATPVGGAALMWDGQPWVSSPSGDADLATIFILLEAGEIPVRVRTI